MLPMSKALHGVVVASLSLFANGFALAIFANGFALAIFANGFALAIR
ncbi:hypothetical protein BTM245_15270 [Helicobacter pylori]